MTRLRETKLPERWMLPDELAHALRDAVTRETVIRWCREGRVDAYKVGAKWLIPREVLGDLEWLKGVSSAGKKGSGAPSDAPQQDKAEFSTD